MSSNRASEPPDRVRSWSPVPSWKAASASATALAITNSSSSAQAALTGGPALELKINSRQGPPEVPSNSKINPQTPSRTEIENLIKYLKVWSRSNCERTVYGDDRCCIICSSALGTAMAEVYGWVWWWIGVAGRGGELVRGQRWVAPLLNNSVESGVHSLRSVPFKWWAPKWVCDEWARKRWHTHTNVAHNSHNRRRAWVE
jgi:hypothetical protein